MSDERTPSRIASMPNASADTADPTVPTTIIEDSAPHRARNANDLVHAAIALLLGACVILFAATLHGTATGVQSDAHSAIKALGWLMDVPASMLQQLVTVGIVVGLLAHMALHRQWSQSAASAVAMFLGYGLSWALSLTVSHIGDTALVASLSSPASTTGIGLLPDVYACMGAFLTLAGPHRTRSAIAWGWNALFALAAIEVSISWHSLAGVLVAFAVGRVAGLPLRFAWGTADNGIRGVQIIQILRGIGLPLARLSHRTDAHTSSGMLRVSLEDDLVENSRLYDAYDTNGNAYVISVLDAHTHATGYLNQLWQWIRLNGIAMRRDRSAADANHHHMSMLLGLRNLGLPTADIYGVADSADSSIMVFRAEGMAAPCGSEDLRDSDIRAVMRYLDTANAHGFTHRRITAQTLARRSDGTMLIAGWHNGDFGGSAAHASMDRVQLLALSACIVGIDRAIALAGQTWGPSTLVELIPFVQKAAIPAATRNLPAWQASTLSALRSALRTLAPEERTETAEPVVLSRFNLRSFATIVLGIVAAAAVFTQLRPDEVLDALSHANPAMAILCVLCGLVAWIGSGITLRSFMTTGRDRHVALFCSQAASGLTAVSMPAGVGPAFTNLQFLRRLGYRTTAATAITSATWAVQALATVIMLLLIGVLTGRNTLSGMVPTNTLVIAIGIAILVAAAAMSITPVRRVILTRYLPAARSYARHLSETLAQPRQLCVAAAGALLLNIALSLGFWVALLAFGHWSNPVETMFVFLLSYTVGSAIPTPGGLGAVEAALTFAFTSVGVPPAVALSATLLYRVAFYWLRIPMGALAMHWLNRRGLI